MPGKKNFEAQLEALDALRQQPDEACVAPLRTALQHRNNYIVSKAAEMVALRHMNELMPELLTAFDRFFEDAVKSDPQCWAKNSLSRALAALELQEPAPFLRGLRHVQMEPVWGGSSDTAGPLRGICALALVQCRVVPEVELLRHLLDLLLDKDKTARADAVRAIEQLDSPAAALLLRLRAQTPMENDEAEILGACYAGVLRIEGEPALQWVSRFLADEDDAAGEAALAISATRSQQAFELLKQRFETARDPWFRSVLLSAIALTRQDAATDFLLRLVESDAMGADQVVEALLRSAPAEDVVLELKKLVKGNARLERVFADNATSSARR
jgi:HEAT repeat protein